jgi:hypothetical protein
MFDMNGNKPILPDPSGGLGANNKMYLYLSTAEVFGGVVPINEILQKISKFRRVEIISALSRINLLLNIFGQDDRKLQHGLVADYFSKVTRDKFDKYISVRMKEPDSASGYVVFHRRQLLCIMQMAAILCVDDENSVSLDNTGEKERYLFGEICLEINDHLHLDQEKCPKSLSPAVQHHLIVELLPSLDLDNEPSLMYEVSRTDLLVHDYYPDKTGIIEKRFIEKYQISLAEFRSFVFAHWGLYREKPKRGEAYHFSLSTKILFKNSPLSKKKQERFWSLISRDVVRLTSQTYSDRRSFPEMAFRTFRQFPILRKGDSLIPLDANFLLATAASDLFWTIHRSLSDAEREDFFSNWGKSFEKYVTDVIKKRPVVKKEIFLSNPIDSSGEEMGDGLLYDGERIAVLEYKSKVISLAERYSGARRELLRAFDNAFLLKNRKLQLVSQIDRLYGKKGEKFLLDNGIKIENIKRIFPVVVTLDRTSQAFLVPDYLRGRFTEKNKNMTLPIAPLVVCHISSLEMFEGYTGTKTLLDIIEENSNLPINSDVTFSRQIEKYLHECGVHSNNNSLLGQRLTEIGKEIMKKFFPAHKLKEDEAS